jgi:hypothetical protein
MASPIITPVVVPENGALSGPLILPVHTPLSLFGPRTAAAEADKEKEKEKEKENETPKEEAAPAKGPGGPGQRKTVPMGAKSGPLRPGGKAGKRAAAETPEEPAEDKPAFQPSVAQVVMPTTPSEWSPSPKGRGVFSKIGGAWDRVCSMFTSTKSK